MRKEQRGTSKSYEAGIGDDQLHTICAASGRCSAPECETAKDVQEAVSGVHFFLGW